MAKHDAVMRAWAFNKIKNKCQPRPRSLPEFEDSTLDKVWGLKPVYTGKIWRRRKDGQANTEKL